MATKFRGAIGFATTVEKAAGVHEEDVVERDYYCTIIRSSRRLDGGDRILDDISVNVSVSIVADPYASSNFFAMRYIRWAGTLWKITEVEPQSPRLTLRLGEVYNGPVATPSSP